MTEQEIRDRLAERLRGMPQTILGSVLAVNKRERTCDIDNDGIVVYGVRLQPVTAGKTGVTVFPATGSQALIVQIENGGDYMLLQASEVECMEVVFGEKSLTADETGFVFNGGSVGAARTDKVVEWMSKVYADLNTLTELLSSSLVAGNGAALGIVFEPKTPNPVLSDFSDECLKHG